MELVKPETWQAVRRVGLALDEAAELAAQDDTLSTAHAIQLRTILSRLGTVVARVPRPPGAVEEEDRPRATSECLELGRVHRAHAWASLSHRWWCPGRTEEEAAASRARGHR